MTQCFTVQKRRGLAERYNVLLGRAVEQRQAARAPAELSLCIRVGDLRRRVPDDGFLRAKKDDSFLSRHNLQQTNEILK